MEKFSKWRDPATGVAPFVEPVSPNSAPLPVIAQLPLRAGLSLLAALRTLLFLLVLLLWGIVEALLLPLMLLRPLHTLLSRIVTAIAARLALLILGFVWISSDTVSQRRLQRNQMGKVALPRKGDIIIANWTSIADVLYLAYRHGAHFLLPVSSLGSKQSLTAPARISGWRRVTFFGAMVHTGYTPERSERGEEFEAALKGAPGPVVVFPECTTSNNRGILRFAELLEALQTDRNKKRASTFLVAFRHETPGPIFPTATCVHPKPFWSHVYEMCKTPHRRQLAVRRLHPVECPPLPLPPPQLAWNALAEPLAATGRLKKTGLSWEDKNAFLEYRDKRKIA